MAPYFIIFGILALLSFTDIINLRKEQRGVLLLCLTSLLIVFAALRSGDHDYISYVEIFKDAQGWDLSASADIGYSLLNGLLGVIWNDPLIIFIAVAAISVALNVKCFNDYGKFVFVALLFYFVHNYALKEMIQIRAGLACAIGLYNIRNLEKGRYAKFWLIQLLAISIHFGAVMYLIAWVVRQFKFTPRTWWFVIGLCFVVGVVYPFGALIKALPGMEMLERVQTYSQWGDYASELGILSNIATLKQLAMCVILLLFYTRLRPHIKYFDTLSAIYFASTCWLMVWNDFAIVGARMATFLSIGEPIFWGSLLFLVTPQSRKILLPLLVVVALVFLVVNMQGKILPYQFYPTI